METEWDDIRDQIRKGYQRMEKANDRADRRQHEDTPEEIPKEPAPGQVVELQGFARKLAQMKEG